MQYQKDRLTFKRRDCPFNIYYYYLPQSFKVMKCILIIYYIKHTMLKAVRIMAMKMVILESSDSELQIHF